MREGTRWRKVGAILAGAIALAAGAAYEAWSQSSLPLPPGTVVTGTVFKQPGQCPPPSVASIATGADANAYICGTPPTLSFVPSASAAMVPTQHLLYFRFSRKTAVLWTSGNAWGNVSKPHGRLIYCRRQLLANAAIAASRVAS